MTLPHPTKKQQIRDLILANSTTKDIVDQVKTTKEYVYKERGKLRQEGLLVTHQSLSISNGQSEITMVKDQPLLGENVDLDVPVTIDRITDVNDYDIPRLDKNSLMLMYDAFEQHKTPAQVIARYGIHPEISQREFERLLTMNSRDPYELQKRLIPGTSEAPQQLRSIIDRSSSNLLTNDEIMSIIEFKIWNCAYYYARDVVLNPAFPSYPGLERVICRICHKQQAGVVYDINTSVGYHAKQALGNYLCNTCNSVQKKDLSPQYNNTQ